MAALSHCWKPSRGKYWGSQWGRFWRTIQVYHHPQQISITSTLSLKDKAIEMTIQTVACCKGWLSWFGAHLVKRLVYRIKMAVAKPLMLSIAWLWIGKKLVIKGRIVSILLLVSKKEIWKMACLPQLLTSLSTRKILASCKSSTPQEALTWGINRTPIHMVKLKIRST